jgi:hypothetical protein
MLSRPKLSTLPVALVAVVLSCLFSVVVILQNPVLNDDAYSYLRAAEVFNQSNAATVLETYGWYAYSIVIALADHVFPGGLKVAAHILNTLSYALLVYVFITLCREYQNLRRVQWFAAMVVLGMPLLNEMRFFLIRDAAFWAFTLLSFLHLLRYLRTGVLSSALWWFLALLVGTLFRLEGLLLLAASPLGVLFTPDPDTGSKRWRQTGILLGVMATGLLAVVVLGFLLQLDLPELAFFAYRYYLPLLGNLLPLLSSSAEQLNQALFALDNFPGSNNVLMGLTILLFAYCFTMAANLVNALSLPVVLLLAHGWWVNRLILPDHCRRPLFIYVWTTLLGLLFFLLIMHFLTQRYTTLPCLLLLSLLPLILNKVYERAVIRNKLRRFRWLLVLFSIYYLIDSLFSFGASKQHIEDAIAWSRSNLPDNAVLHTNQYAIAYESGRIPEYDRITTSADDTVRFGIDPTLGNLGQRDGGQLYFLLDVRQSETDLQQRLDSNQRLQRITAFTNNRGDQIRVYRLL